MTTEKHSLLKRLNQAYASGDMVAIAECITEDVSWTLMGSHTIKGKSSFLKEMQKMLDGHKQKISISRIITHGREATVEGQIEMTDKAGNTSYYAFCDVHTFDKFKNGKVKEITSYVINTKNK